MYIADYRNNRIRKISNVVEVNEQVAQHEAVLVAYPNPNAGSFTLLLSGAGNEEVKVVLTDVTGRVIKMLTGRANQPAAISVDVPNGVYLMSVSAGSNWTTSKVTIFK